MKKFAILLTGLLAAGAALAGSKQGKAEDAWRATLPEPNADYGTLPNDHESIVKTFYGDILKDPDSAKYSDFIGPRQNYRILSLKERSVQYGYVVCFRINSKNS